MMPHGAALPIGPMPGDPDTDRPWLLMSIAPRDRPIDLRGERWVVGHERMRVEVFPRCIWSPGGTARQPSPRWKRLPVGWTATHWRETDPTPDA